jgi:hypothetical protein
MPSCGDQVSVSLPILRCAQLRSRSLHAGERFKKGTCDYEENCFFCSLAASRDFWMLSIK